uniref:Uncharacterized protein n=1 Tax=uncultured marine virus TaxID=186617 RepID=A0A0F7L9S2_9VIRU|nr:hypothetical protein [uncultured marine virus]
MIRPAVRPAYSTRCRPEQGCRTRPDSCANLPNRQSGWRSRSRTARRRSTSKRD